jgi:hypothetical protein
MLWVMTWQMVAHPGLGLRMYMAFVNGVHEDAACAEKEWLRYDGGYGGYCW